VDRFHSVVKYLYLNSIEGWMARLVNADAPLKIRLLDRRTTNVWNEPSFEWIIFGGGA